MFSVFVTWVMVHISLVTGYSDLQAQVFRLKCSMSDCILVSNDYSAFEMGEMEAIFEGQHANLFWTSRSEEAICKHIWMK